MASGHMELDDEMLELDNEVVELDHEVGLNNEMVDEGEDDDVQEVHAMVSSPKVGHGHDRVWSSGLVLLGPF